MTRIRLARASSSDADDLIRANRESRDFHAPWVQPFTDQSGFEAWLARTLTGPNVSLVARETVSHGVVGVINISEIIAGAFHSAYLGYYAMARFARQGFMTEALGMATHFAFDDIGLHRLEANIQPANGASLALVKRLGFQKEGYSPRYLRIDGEWRDHERWALLSDMERPDH